MKLDLDCIRDILLTVESIEYGENLTISVLQERIPKYSESELQYHCVKLLEAGFLKALSLTNLSSPETIYRIEDLTYEGHQFLANIRPETVWDKTKEIAKDIKSESLLAIKDIAFTAFTTLIQNKLGL